MQGFRFFSRLVGQSDPWSKNGGSFSEMMGLSITNHSWHLGSILYLYTDTCMHTCIYSKPCLRQPLKKEDPLSLNEGQTYCRMLQGEHFAILLIFIKLPFVIKIFVLSYLSGCLRHVLLY